MMDQTTTGGNFSEADRTTLITLAVDMGYMKKGIDGLRGELSAHANEVATDVAKLWVAVEDLRKFRWWAGGAIASASLIGGAVMRFIFK